MKIWQPEKWASVGLTGWCLLGIIGWFYLAAAIADSSFFKAGLSAMNNFLVRDWFMNEAVRQPWVLGWLVVLLLLAALLAVNLAACLWLRLVRARGNGRGVRFWGFFSLHFFFGLVMILHGLEMVAGEKHSWQSARAGDVIKPDAAWSVQVHEINYVNDVDILKPDRSERRSTMTSKAFDVQANFVRVSLLHQGRKVKNGQIRIMRPLKHESVEVVLRRFEYGPQGLSARLRIVDAPLHPYFFTAYLLFIASLMLCLLLRLQPPDSGGS